MAKKTKEIWKTYEGVFDQFTHRNLFKLSSQGHFNEILSPISIGKESNIFSAKTKDGLIILKIYRLQNCDFNKMYEYIRVDPRYQWLKKHRRKIIFAWTQREFRNLIKARESGVNVPKAITFKDNIILMEYMGDKKDVAPKLKNSPPHEPEKFLKLIIRNMKKLYKNNLVHGDLSPFNILNDKEKPIFIDFSQSSLMSGPNSQELLTRDIKNMYNYFKKQGLKISEQELKEQITK